MFRNLAVRKKLLFSFGIVALLFVVGSVISHVELNSLYRHANLAAVDDAPRTEAILEVQYLVTKGHLWFEEIMAGDTNEQIEEVNALWDEAAQLCHALLDGGTVNGRRLPVEDHEEDREALGKIKEALTHLRDLAGMRYSNIELGITGSEADQQFDEAYEEVLAFAEQFEDDVRAEVIASTDRIQLVYATAWKVAVAVFLVVIAIIILLTRHVGSLIARPIQRLVEASECMTAGDLDAAVQVESTDEIGYLGEQFNAMVVNLKRRMEVLQTIADTSSAFDNSEKIEEGLNVLLAGAKKITGARYAALSIFGEDGAVEKFLTLGLSAQEEARIGHYPTGKGLMGHLQDHEAVLRLDDMSEHPRSAGFPPGHPSMKALLATSIRQGGVAYGNLYLADKEDGAETFSEDDEAILKQLAELAATSVSGRQAREQRKAQRLYLTRSVDHMLTEIERFAEGDLSVHLNAERDDEIGRLYDGFNKAIANIRTLMGQVRETVEMTTAAATQIGSATEQLAAGSQEQSAQAGEVAAAVEEMARTIVENASNASHTADVAGRSGKVAREGGEIVQQTLEKIGQIAEVVGASAETVERLGDSSQEIGEIVKVINEIADQTNLLALNAAIEAARAGEQGRGFAVVADEVRKLAERTTTATQQIAEMIKTVQVETGEAVQSMQDGRQKVEEGRALADRAGGVLHRIVEEAEGVVDMVSQIAVASEQQSATSEQISRSVESISTVSNESARGVTEIARSTDDLNRMTDELRTLVTRFRFSDEAARPQHAAEPGGDGWNSVAVRV
ncbi:MAG: methyl-accepting chemotaxis protein [Rhodothermales bacterium]